MTFSFCSVGKALHWEHSLYAVGEKLPTYSSKYSELLQFFSYSNNISGVYQHFFSPRVDRKLRMPVKWWCWKIATKSTQWILLCQSHGWIFTYGVHWKFHRVKAIGEFSPTVLFHPHHEGRKCYGDMGQRIRQMLRALCVCGLTWKEQIHLHSCFSLLKEWMMNGCFSCFCTLCSLLLLWYTCTVHTLKVKRQALLPKSLGALTWAPALNVRICHCVFADLLQHWF